MIYHTYRECVANARMMFVYYEKYNNCIALESLDRDMDSVFNKIALDYTKFMMLINNRIELDNPDNLPHSLLSICNSRADYELRSAYLEKIEELMDKNEGLMVRIFARIDFKCIDQEVDTLKRNLQNASKLINRMEMLLMRSQNIYEQKFKISA